MDLVLCLLPHKLEQKSFDIVYYYMNVPNSEGTSPPILYIQLYNCKQRDSHCRLTK